MVNNDEKLLKALYSMRVLSRSIISKYFTVRRIDTLLSFGVVKKQPHEKDIVYFLTPKGIRFIREEFDFWGLKEVTAAKLKMNSHALNHQLALNSFVLEYASKTKAKYTYYDEKFMPKCSRFMMPDGFLEISDTIYLLEMDMGYETKKDLERKWSNYRGFLSYTTGYYYGKKIRCLFILENVKLVTKRAAYIEKSISLGILDLISPDFDIILNDRSHLIEGLLTGFRDYTLNMLSETLYSHGFSVSPAKKFGYTLYIRKLNGKEIVFEDGRLQEFFLDVWDNKKAGTLSNIAFFSRRNREYEETLGRRMSLIVVSDDLNYTAKILHLTDSYSRLGDVFFTTKERLEKFPMPEALYALEYSAKDKAFLAYNFDSMGLKDRKYAKKIPLR